MRYWGFSDAEVTPPGADGGLDVIASRAVAQVKDYGSPVGRPVLQQLVGAALGRLSLCFARQSFTQEAKAWAATAGVALFRFDLQGVPQPENDVAVELAKHSLAQSDVASDDSTHLSAYGESPTILFVPPVMTARRAASAIKTIVRQDRRNASTVSGSYVGYVAACRLELAFASRAGGSTLHARSATADVGLDTLGALVSTGAYLKVSVETLPTRAPAFEVDEMLARYGLRSPAVAARPAATERIGLTWLGLPPDAADVHVLSSSRYWRPVAVAVVQSKMGRRVVAVDLFSSAHDSLLSDSLTRASVGEPHPFVELSWPALEA